MEKYVKIERYNLKYSISNFGNVEQFIPNVNNFPQVDHINEDKKNNLVENLQWISAKDNTRKTQSVEVYQKTLRGKIIKKWSGFGHITEELGFNKSNIHKCCSGKKPTMYGFKWSYV